jgi:DNA (cytosine-5)-methyltransferase 1
MNNPVTLGKATLYNYQWTLKDAVFTKDKGKVFSCFSCGGGSTMGYKLAGFDVIGCNEIDKKMFDMYVKNHNPKFAYNEPIQTFKLRDDLPKELFELDILDGSPPCSSFSMSGNRSDDWGKEKKFREGQSLQVLDTLFFDFIDLAEKLQPKIVIAENVKGLLLGEAKSYVLKIYNAFDKAGYIVRHFLLDASKMGVPQRRERVFFLALRKDLCDIFLEDIDLFTSAPAIDLSFNHKPITFKEIRCEAGILKKSERQKLLLENYQEGDKCIEDINQRLYNKCSGFNATIQYDENVMLTICSRGEMYRAFDRLHCTNLEFMKAGTYPIDYDFNGNKPRYAIGMSVPPTMMAQIATRISQQWLNYL